MPQQCAVDTPGCCVQQGFGSRLVNALKTHRPAPRPTTSSRSDVTAICPQSVSQLSSYAVAINMRQTVVIRFVDTLLWYPKHCPQV